MLTVPSSYISACCEASLVAGCGLYPSSSLAPMRAVIFCLPLARSGLWRLAGSVGCNCTPYSSSFVAPHICDTRTHPPGCVSAGMCNVGLVMWTGAARAEELLAQRCSVRLG